MIRLGLRLTLSGGRDALVRLLVIAIAVTLGVGMLLTTLAGINAVNAQNGRYAWLETGATSSPAPAPAAAGHVDPVWWLLRAEFFHGQLIGRVDVATTGPNSPVPPGMSRLPAPGEFYASPALTKLLDSTPRDQLAARYPGRQVGTIGAAALPAPNTLLIVVGDPPSRLAAMHGASEVTSIGSTTPSSCNGACYYVGIDANGIDLVLSVVAAALLFPVLIFIGTATRLSAARREQRFAALRLVGATPRQVSVISAVESSVAAVLGVACGFALFYLLRPVLAPIPFTGAPFFTSDLSLNLADVIAVAIGVPVAAAVAARLALRRVTTSPLGVTRRVTPTRPRAWRVIPLLAGLGELAWFVLVGRPDSTPGQIQAFMTGILVTMAGLIVAGPWLTYVGARLVTRHTDRVELLIGGRRLADNPRAGFRAISGLVLALFVGSVAIGVITTISSYDGGADATAAEHRTLVEDFTDFTPSGIAFDKSIPTSVLSELRAIPGLQGMTTVHARTTTGPVFPISYVACAQLPGTPTLGSCPMGTSVAASTQAFDQWRGGNGQAWTATSLTVAQLQALPVQAIVVEGETAAAVERARTVLTLAFPDGQLPTSTIAESMQQNNSRTAAYQRLADVVILTSLPIAGASLAVSVVAGLNDRKRPFSLLRLAGTPIGVLRRVVTLESVVPLLAMAIVSIGTGFLTAGLFLSSQLGESLRPPGASYYVLVAVGVLASLAIIASTLPLLRRLTGPEVARND